jgi:hypothetical protein
MSGSEGGGVAVSLNGNPLPRVDVAENGLRERQHCPWREEFFKLIAILPRQTFGEVLARIPGREWHGEFLGSGGADAAGGSVDGWLHGGWTDAVAGRR